MNSLLYGFIALGAIVLLADANGFIVVAPERVRWFRIIGLIAVAIVGLAPLLLVMSAEWLWWYPPIVVLYLLLALAFAAGTVGWLGPRYSRSVQRLAYAGLLLVVAIPSMVLLSLAPVVAVAGAALARPDEREAERVTEFKSAALRPDPPREEE